MIIEKTCCFTGPRPKNFPWQNEDERYIIPLTERLEKEIRKAIDKGYRHFISGMAIGVDMYAASIVLKIRKEQSDLGLTLEAAVPFPSQPDKWTETQKLKYAVLLKKADKQTIIGQEPTTENFNKRNDYMVDNASMLIAVNSDKPGGTQRTINYAKTKQREVVVIDPMEFYM